MELETSSPSGDGMNETTIDEVLGSGGADSRSPGDVLVSALWRAVLDIQSYAQRQHHGTLCQVWLPELKMDCSVALHTKGLPFCMAGVGDLLALFRCISCRYGFGTDASCPELLGAPGRVFTSGTPELSREVPQQGAGAVVAADPERMHSVLVLPLFMDGSRSRAVGVLEVVQTVREMAVAAVIATIAGFLQRSGLFTCQPDAVPSEAPARLQAAMQSLSKLAVGESPRSTLSPRSPPEGCAGGPAAAAAQQAPSATAPADRPAPSSNNAFHCSSHQHKLTDSDEDESGYYGPYQYAPPWSKKPQVRRSTPVEIAGRSALSSALSSAPGSRSMLPPPLPPPPPRQHSQPPAQVAQAQELHQHQYQQASQALPPSYPLPQQQQPDQCQIHQESQPPAQQQPKHRWQLEYEQRLQHHVPPQQQPQQPPPQPQQHTLPDAGYTPMQLDTAPPLAVPQPAAPGLAQEAPNAGFLDMMDDDSLGLGSGSWDDFDMMFGGAASGSLPDAGPLSPAADYQQQPQDTHPLQPRRRGKGSAGKPGKRLKREELEAHFGLGLREAADRLGICATTLKRACRRVGIQRWPRRLVPSAGGATSAGQQGDMRWQALGDYVPGSGGPTFPIATLPMQQGCIQTATPQHGFQQGVPQPGSTAEGVPQLGPTAEAGANHRCTWIQGSGASIAAAAALDATPTPDSSTHGGSSFLQPPLPPPAVQGIPHGLMQAAQQQLASLQPQANGTTQLQQQRALPPLAATSPQLSGLLSQLLQHLSQELGRQQAGTQPVQQQQAQYTSGPADPLPGVQPQALPAMAANLQTNGLNPPPIRSPQQQAPQQPPAPAADQAKQRGQQRLSGRHPDIAAALHGFKHDTGGTLPCIAEPDSLSFLGIDELLDQEAAGDSSGHHRQLDALASGELAAFEMPA